MLRLSMTTHARLDATSVLLMLELPRLLRLGSRASRASWLLALLGVVTGGGTDYPYPVRGPRLLSPCDMPAASG
ncbi:hypothetical protein [Deinococcus sonorensis]|uniref:Transposase n=2 Tax=Deinococcus sonorensis TaxID=309891 RepID=A0AAU7UGB4_9DEIO